MERVVISHFYERERFFLLSFFATFAITLLFSDLLRNIYGSSFYQIETPDFPIVFVFGTSISTLRLAAAGIAILVLVGLYLLTNRTYIGMSMRAIASSEDGATIVGINKTKISMFTFGLGAVITGVTGILYAMIFSASYSMGFEFSSFAFIIVVVGGVGSFYGTIAASILVGLIQSYTAYFIGSRYRLIVMFGILMLILIWKPTGFQGREL